MSNTEHLVALTEALLEQERYIVQGVAVGDFPPEALAEWEQSYGGTFLATLHKMFTATTEAIAEMERLGIAPMEVPHGP